MEEYSIVLHVIFLICAYTRTPLCLYHCYFCRIVMTKDNTFYYFIPRGRCAFSIFSLRGFPFSHLVRDVIIKLTFLLRTGKRHSRRKTDIEIAIFSFEKVRMRIYIFREEKSHPSVRRRVPEIIRRCIRTSNFWSVVSNIP